MKTTILEDEFKVAEKVASIWMNIQNNHDGEFIFSAPLSSTPLPLYDYVLRNVDKFDNWKNFKFLMMDEQMENRYEYKFEDNQASYLRFAKENFLNELSSKTDFEIENIIMPDPSEFQSYSKKLSERGGIDLLVLATGAGGHYAQVVPGTSKNSSFGLYDLSKIPGYSYTHTTGSGAYKDAKFNNLGMSIGHKELIEAKKIILMITGKKKAEVYKKFLEYDGFDKAFPISILLKPTIAPKTDIIISTDVFDN